MLGHYYGIDIYYVILVLPCLIFSMWAQHSVNSTFNRYSKVFSRRGLSGAQAAAAVLRQNGINNVRIEHISGNLSDHFDPSGFTRKNTSRKHTPNSSRLATSSIIQSSAVKSLE